MSIDVIGADSARKTYEDWHRASDVRDSDLIFFSGVVGHSWCTRRDQVNGRKA